MMKKEQVHFGESDSTDNGYHSEEFGGDRDRPDSPSQIVISIQESVHQLRKLLEEKREWEAGNGPVFTPTIPLNFHFKSIMELSHAVKSKFSNNARHKPPTTVTTVATLHQEQRMFSVKDGAHCNSNGNARPQRHDDVKLGHANEPDEVQRISELIKSYNLNDQELVNDRKEITGLQGQPAALREPKEFSEQERANLTRISVAGPENKGALERPGTSKRKISKLDSIDGNAKLARRPNAAWHLVRKATGRVCFGILEALF